MNPIVDSDLIKNEVFLNAYKSAKIIIEIGRAHV